MATQQQTPATTQANSKKQHATFGKSQGAPFWLVLVGLLAIGLSIFLIFGGGSKNSSKEKNAENVMPTPPPPVVIPEYPKGGNVTIYQNRPAKVWFIPKKTYTRPSGPVYYVYEWDKSRVWYDTLDKGVLTQYSSDPEIREAYNLLMKFPAGPVKVYIWGEERDSLNYHWSLSPLD